jgi:uncharacterized protein (DUF2062 family)
MTRVDGAHLRLSICSYLLAEIVSYIVMIENPSFMSGVWCGAIMGAATMVLILSLILESEQRKRARALRRIRKLWE